MTGLGTLLEEARLERGLTIEEVAERTKIRIEFLQAIEEGEFHKLPGQAYVRPFIRTYARALGLEEEKIILELDARLAPSEEQLALMREESERKRLEQRKRFIWKIAGIGVIILGVGILLYRLMFV